MYMTADGCWRQCIEGDLIEICRGLYSHWALYIGEGEIIHISCESCVWTEGFQTFMEDFFNKSVVRIQKLTEVANQCTVIINNSLDSKYQHKAIENIREYATNKVGKGGYSFGFGNCETFVNDCRYGKPVSFQALFALQTFMGAAAGIYVAEKTTKKLEDKIGFKWATFAGWGAGLLVQLAVDSHVMTDFLCWGVENISKLVMLKVIPSVATNIFTVATAGYVIYQIVTDEIFLRWIRALGDRFSGFCGSLYGLLSGSGRSTDIQK